MNLDSNPSTLEQDDVIDQLNTLIQLDYDAIKAYQQAIERIDEVDIDVRDDLMLFQADHQRHVEDLTRVVRDLGGEPQEQSRDLKGVLLEGMTALRSATGTLGALRAMRMNEKLTNRSYDKAVGVVGFPPIAQAVIEQNREDERRHLTTIQTHIERLSDTSIDEDDDVAIGAPHGDLPGVRM